MGLGWMGDGELLGVSVCVWREGSCYPQFSWEELPRISPFPLGYAELSGLMYTSPSMGFY